MEAKRNTDNSETINLELVLEEFIKEQKSQTKSTNDLTLTINSLSERLTNFEKEILRPKHITSPDNTKPIQEIIKKGMSDIHFFISTQQQKPVIKKYQLLLFPEQDARLFYKIVFGRWLLWLIFMLFMTNLYKLAIHMSDNKREIKLKILENDRFVKSWNKMYLKSSNRIKKIMDSAYFNSVEH